MKFEGELTLDLGDGLVKYFPVTASGDEYELRDGRTAISGMKINLPEELKALKLNPSFNATLSTSRKGIRLELPPLDEMFLDLEEFEEACDRWRQELLAGGKRG